MHFYTCFFFLPACQKIVPEGSQFYVFFVLRGLKQSISIATFGLISPRMTAQKALIDKFSSSTNLWGFWEILGPLT